METANLVIDARQSMRGWRHQIVELYMELDNRYDVDDKVKNVLFQMQDDMLRVMDNLLKVRVEICNAEED